MAYNIGGNRKLCITRNLTQRVVISQSLVRVACTSRIISYPLSYTQTTKTTDIQTTRCPSQDTASDRLSAHPEEDSVDAIKTSHQSY